MIVGAYAGGRLFAAALGSFVVWPKQATDALAAATVAMGVALVLSAAPIPLPLIAGCFALAGYANALQVLSIRTLVHDTTEPHRIPHVFTGLGSINNAATLIGTFGGSVLIGMLTGELTLLICGALTALVGTDALSYGDHRDFSRSGPP